jgi:hypothetical protein
MHRRAEDELGVEHTWGTGSEVVFLSNPLADPVEWSGGVRDELLTLGYGVTTSNIGRAPWTGAALLPASRHSSLVDGSRSHFWGGHRGQRSHRR